MRYTNDNRPTLLALNDQIEIDGHIITVESDGYPHGLFLRYPTEDQWDVIDDTYGSADCFCRKAYGYEPQYGCWPETMPDDYDAITRAANQLFDLFYNPSHVEYVNPYKDSPEHREEPA